MQLCDYFVLELNFIETETRYSTFKCICNYVSILMKEGNDLFNVTVNTFYLWIYGIRHNIW